MKLLFKILLSLIGLFITVNLFLDDTVVVERSVEIKSPVNKIFMKVANTREWKNWDYGSELDPNLSNSYKGPVFGEGAIRSWTSKKSGVGKMAFTKVELNKRINYNLDFTKPFESHSKGEFIFQQEKSITKITWKDTQTYAFHMKFFGLLADNIIGSAFDKSLQNLKELCETNTDKYAILMFEKEAFDIYSKRTTCSVADIGKTLENLYGTLFTDLVTSNNNMFGKPICFYHEFKSDSVDLEAALPVHMGHNNDVKKVNKATVIKATYVGPYDQTQPAYDALDEFVNRNGLQIESSHYQVYLTDPALVTNPNKWVTELFYTLK